VRTGCEGSGRGPPSMLGVVGRGGGGNAGRGAPAVPGRPPDVAGRPLAGGVAGFGGVAAGGCTMRGCDTAGRFAGVNGRAGCVGLPGSSMRRRIVGGTTRGGAWGCRVGGSGAGSTTGASSTAGAAATAGSATCGGGSTRGGSGAGATSVTGGGGAAATGGGAGGASSTGGAGGCAGLIVLTRRGGPSTGAVGFGGSAFFDGAVFLAPPFGGAGVSANMSPPGSEMPRCRATRSTNDRATTSSIVLDALFSSMP